MMGEYLAAKVQKSKLKVALAVFLKSASFVSFTDKNFKCLTEIKILSVQMSDTKIQDVLHRIRTCLTEITWSGMMYLSVRPNV